MWRNVGSILKWGSLICAGLLFVAGVWAWKAYQEERVLLNHFRTTEKETYLVLFENHMELRPTGGFIGNFAEVTVSEGQITDYQVINANDFDYGKPGKKPPQPLGDVLNLPKQQMRDANWNPDFKETAEVVRNLYQKEGGDKDIAGVIGVTSHVLPEVMTYTGPLTVEGVEGEITPENVLVKIQRELNFGYQNTPERSRANRKRPLKRLVRKAEKEIRNLSWREKWRLSRDMYTLADEKQMLFSFQNPRLQTHVENLGWAGRVKEAKDGYLYVVDANLGALKTDRVMEREWSVSERSCPDSRDICGTLNLTYTNTAEKRDRLTTRYRSHTRVYLPRDAYVHEVKGISGTPEYEKQETKKKVGFLLKVPVDSSKTVTLSYTRPHSSPENSGFLIQKQPGVEEIPVSVSRNGQTIEKTIRKDYVFRFE